MLPDQISWSDSADFLHWLAYLRQKFNGRCSHIDADLLGASIEDALLHFRDHPEEFDASRGSLSHYLWLRTRHYLDKRLRKVKRRRQHEKTVGLSEKNFEKIVSEVRRRGGIYLGQDRTEQEAEERREETERQRQALDAIMADLNLHDRASVELLCTGAAR
jgi:hypothetical protein